MLCPTAEAAPPGKGQLLTHHFWYMWSYTSTMLLVVCGKNISIQPVPGAQKVEACLHPLVSTQWASTSGLVLVGSTGLVLVGNQWSPTQVVLDLREVNGTVEGKGMEEIRWGREQD